MSVDKGWANARAASAPLSLLAAALLFASTRAGAADFDPLFYGTNDYGDVGLLQTPTARMRPDGEFGFGASTVRPYNQLLFFLQPLPWLETSIHYVDITNRFYGAEDFSGGQHYKHRGVDGKVRLLSEGEYWPSIALGVQDIGGTGLFSSEYLVSSYHYYDFDFSFGLAWGRLGSRGGIRNPLALISSHFDESRFTGSNAGALNSGRLFSGHDIGPFGGMEWNTPLKGLALRVEYDGNDYRHEPLDDNQKVNSPVNVGLAYRGLPAMDLGLGYERGNTVMGRITIYTNFQSFRGVAKTADPPPPAVTALLHPTASLPGAQRDQAAAPASATTDAAQIAAARAANGAPPADGQTQADKSGAVPVEQRKAFVLALRQQMRAQGYTLMALDYDEVLKEVRVWLSQDRYRNPAQAVGRAARVLCATAPSGISQFTLIYMDQGMENYRAAVRREEFEKAARSEADFDTGIFSIVLTGPGNGYGAAQYIDQTYLPKFSWDMGPAVRQSVGGPNGFYFGQLYWKVGAGVELTDHINLSTAAGFNIVNNFNQITLQSDSTLPHVRSDIVKYLQQGANGLINLEADYTWSPYPDWYHRISVGIFEEMYGGVATELLFRPYGRSWAVALDINRVKQRGYDEMFDFLPYTVTTGHATLYYKPGYYNLLFKLSAGQYLARDRGAMLDISREFDSGVRVGAFATKTNVSAVQFGEGSFDKGVYISMPLDLFFAQSTRREAGFTFRPLTRDGGQMVYDGPELYFTEKGGQPDDFARGAPDLFK